MCCNDPSEYRKKIWFEVLKKILTNHKTFLKTAKHITQHQELSKMDINGQLSNYFANKSQLTIPGIYCAISHAYSKGTNLQN